MPLIGSSLGFLVGFTLGLLGGGGSVLTVPLLVYVLGLQVKVAIASSLAVVGFVALVGVWRHARSGNVEVRTALVFGGVAMLGSFAGARGAALIPGRVQLTLFALTMLAAATFMFRGRRPARDVAPGSESTVGQGDGAESAATPGEPPRGEVPLPAVVATALGVGVLTGVVGVGGGFLIVPALVLLLRLSMHRAVGTSLLVIALNASAGFAGYIGQVSVPWRLLGGFTAFAALGILVGARAMRIVRPAALRKGFAVFLVAVACFMLFN